MILAKLKMWALWLGSILVAVGSAWLWGHRSGRQAERQADAARDAQAAVQAVQQQLQAQEARNDVEAKVSQLPSAPSQPVATADLDTAAGKLRADWMRD